MHLDMYYLVVVSKNQPRLRNQITDTIMLIIVLGFLFSILYPVYSRYRSLNPKSYPMLPIGRFLQDSDIKELHGIDCRIVDNCNQLYQVYCGKDREFYLHAHTGEILADCTETWLRCPPRKIGWTCVL